MRVRVYDREAWERKYALRMDARSVWLKGSINPDAWCRCMYGCARYAELGEE